MSPGSVALSNFLFSLCGATLERVVSAFGMSFIQNDKVIGWKTKTFCSFKADRWSVHTFSLDMDPDEGLQFLTTGMYLIGRSFSSLRLKPKVSHMTFSRRFEESRLFWWTFNIYLSICTFAQWWVVSLPHVNITYTFKYKTSKDPDFLGYPSELPLTYETHILFLLLNHEYVFIFLK